MNVELVYFEKVNFATQQNRLPVIQSLLLHNETQSSYEDLTISVTLSPELSETCESRLEQLAPESSVSIKDLIIKLSAEYLSTLTERILGEIRLCIKSKEEIIYENNYPLEILAFDEWGGVTLYPEMLAAFVTPNHPSLAVVLRRAAEILEEWTGDASFNAYQTHSSDRVRKQMGAIYQSLAEQKIIYCNPPASYEKQGQRVRLGDACLGQKLGTCLDMALLYAACLEAVGINPILVLIHGHAFAGAWLVDEMLSDRINDDVSALTKRLAAGINEIALVETTGMNASRNVPFDLACKAGEDHLLKTEEFHYSLDIKRCRLAGIKPLPQRVPGEQGYVLEEAPPSLLTHEAPAYITPQAPLIDLQSSVATKQKVWERKLLDLSLRNNLLNARIGRNSLQLMATNLSEWEDKLAEGQQFTLHEKPSEWKAPLDEERGSTRELFSSIAQADPIIELLHEQLRQNRLHSYLTPAELDKSLTQLYRQSRLSLEENGANTLYLALGMLRWYETEKSERARFAPLLLMPVEIKRKSAQRGYTIRASEEETTMNITLLEMLKQDFGIDMSSLSELPRDANGVDVQLIFNSIRSAIKGQARWDIEEKAILGIFSFSKFIMWNDIHHYASKLCENPIVQSLVAGQLEYQQPELKDNLNTLALPVSADGYQVEAISHAAQDSSFILHGPPGSGKSQTITNMISNALYQGKKVLFVAEKMAALSVVQTRLAKIGLAPFCLELHSNKSTKSAVLTQLQQTTELAESGTAAHFEQEAARLHALREQIASPVAKLHHRYPLGISLYDALHLLEGIPATEPSYQLSDSNLCELPEERWESMQQSLDELQQIALFCQDVVTHPLANSALSHYSPTLQQQVDGEITSILEQADSLLNAIPALSELLGYPLDELPYEHGRILASLCAALLDEENPLNAHLLRVEQLNELRESFTSLLPHGQKRDQLRSQLLQSGRDSLLSLDGKAQLAAWEQAEQSWFIPRFFALRGLKKQLRAHFTTLPEESAIADTLRDLISYQDAQAILASHQARFTRDMGTHGDLEQAHWDKMQRSIEGTLSLSQQLIALTKSIPHSLDIRRKLASELSQGHDSFLTLHRDTLTAYSQAWQGYLASEEQLSSTLQLKSNYQRDESQSQNLYEWRSYYDGLITHLASLRDWTLWNKAQESTTDPLLRSYLGWLQSHTIPLESIKSSFVRALLRRFIDSAVQSEPELTDFKGAIFESKLEQFRALSKQHETLTRQAILATLAARLPSLQGRSMQNSELGILLRAIKSRGRGISIRQLFDQIPELLLRLKPCMLMSPLSVAQFIDLDNIQFDLVIFDEASQMPTCEAVGAIARGKNVVIVGDPKQMPPTSFFSSSSVDEDNIALEDLESILDDCLALSMPSKYLRWHYRSKHESLIAFSNTQYYESRLLTYPSPDDLSSKVTWQHVAGYYDKGKTRQNAAEAQAIVDEVLARLRDPQRRQRSIGIITFSVVQQNLIEDKLMQAFAKPENHELELLATQGEEALFVKNLENVQGDERDIILFSVAYGPDEQGKISMNFGPLNREGGWRRLNVAVSRARYEMKVFSTLKAEQIDLARSSSEGVAGLKNFLDFAHKGTAALPRQAKDQQLSKRSLIDSLAARIREAGYELNTHVGCSGYRLDMAVVHPHKEGVYLAAIVCDGEHYASTENIHDREITQQSVLRMLGWNLIRLWVMDWVHEPERSIQRVIDQLNELRDRPEPEEAIEEEQPAQPATSYKAALPATAQLSELVEEEQSKSGDEQAASPYLIEYKEHRLGKCPYEGEDFTKREFRSHIMEQLRELIQAEAPVHGEYLCRRIMTHWGTTRMTKRIKDYFEALLSEMQLNAGGESMLTSFYWRADQQPESYKSYRLHPRDIDHIAPEELSVLACSLIEQTLSLPRTDLQREMANRLGYTKMGKNILSATEAGIALALQRGELIDDEGRLKQPSSA